MREKKKKAKQNTTGVGDTVRAAEREGGAVRCDAMRCDAGVRLRSGVLPRGPAARCCGARRGAVRRCGGAGLGAGGSGTRLALISYSNFSAPTQPARHWPDVMRGDVTPARRPLAAGGAAQLF